MTGDLASIVRARFPTVRVEAGSGDLAARIPCPSGALGPVLLAEDDGG